MKIVQPLPEVKGCTRVIYDVLEKRDLLDLLEFVNFFSPCKTIEITVKVMMLMSNTAERK